jgi:lipopolysaccharide export system ATP-binding protein
MISDNQKLVEARSIVKNYHRHPVVNEVNLHVNRNEIVGLLGPNGAGKTTTFYVVVGLIKPDSGSIVFDGKDITLMPMYRRARMGIGYLPQEPSVFRRLSVKDNIIAILETMDITRAERKEKAGSILADLGLERIAGQKAYTLSGGERRKLEIARALVTDPSVLMLDEPFSGVDPLAVYDIQKIITDLSACGMGILITDHNVRETLAVVDRAYLLYEGKVLRDGASSFLINDEVSRELYLGEKFRM